MKPFDLEAAKRGAKFYVFGDPSLVCSLVGVAADGRVVYERARITERQKSPVICEESVANLRMLAIKKRVAVSLYRNGSERAIFIEPLTRPPFYAATGEMWIGERHNTFAQAQEAAVRGSYAKCYIGTTCVEWEE